MIPSFIKRNFGPWVLVIVCVFTLGAGYGYLFEKHHVFPYRILKRFVSKTELANPEMAGQLEDPSEALVSTIATNLLRLTKTVHKTSETLDLHGYGGGLVSVDDVVLGSDLKGSFFLFLSDGEVKPLQLNLEFNYDAFLDFIQKQDYNDWWTDKYSRNVAVLGLNARKVGTGLELYVCHEVWYPDEKSKGTQVSKLLIPNWENDFGQSERFSPSDWEPVCKIEPKYEFTDIERRGFTTNHRGGRIEFLDDDTILLSIGDHRQNGWNSDYISSQDPNGWQGKILEVDLESGDISIFVMGLRNPQGLYVADDGRIWETEHGPKGGDELNLLTKGGNYGWPVVTLGSDYEGFDWPLSREQGRHEGYTVPVFAWLPSIAVSNLKEVTKGPAVWAGDLMISSLLKMSLFRARLEGDRVIYVEQIEIGQRIRDLVELEGGGFLLWCDSGDLIELRETSEAEELFEIPPTEVEREAGLVPILNQCAACHDLIPERAKSVAPTLWGIEGRAIGKHPFSGYSDAMMAKEGVWDRESLANFLNDPQSFIPGTIMPPVEIAPDKMDLLIDYLEKLE